MGTMEFLNGSDPQPFEHIYEIVFFEIGQPSHWVFDLVESNYFFFIFWLYKKILRKFLKNIK